MMEKETGEISKTKLIFLEQGVGETSNILTFKLINEV